jgi:hypothetical protein
MGLLDMLTTQGSAFTAYDGNNPPINPLATQQSKLHADGNQPGYSLNGANANQVTSDYNAYNDGVGNQIPLPSLLDINGITPTQYLNNLPG